MAGSLHHGVGVREEISGGGWEAPALGLPAQKRQGLVSIWTSGWVSGGGWVGGWYIGCMGQETIGWVIREAIIYWLL